MSSGGPPSGPPPSSFAETLPSSFDGDEDFYNENRWSKLSRRLKEEPLIPIGCLATCYALYMATKSIRAGDHHTTNRMFRARIYAQGFTLVALLGGTIYYKDERLQRKRLESKMEDKKSVERREKWLRELEARDREDQEWRASFKQVGAVTVEPPRDVKKMVEDGVKKIEEMKEGTESEVKRVIEEGFRNKSVFEEVVTAGWGPGTWLSRTSDAWRRR